MGTKSEYVLQGENFIEKYAEDKIVPYEMEDLVIHLRLGDTFGINHPHNALPIKETYIKLLDSILGNESRIFKRVVFCCNLNFAGFGGKIFAIDECSVSKSCELLEKLSDTVESYSLDWYLQSSVDPDEDFCNLALCKNLVLSVSRFSTLATECSVSEKYLIYTQIYDLFEKHKSDLPPWDKKGKSIEFNSTANLSFKEIAFLAKSFISNFKISFQYYRVVRKILVYSLLSRFSIVNNRP